MGQKENLTNIKTNTNSYINKNPNKNNKYDLINNEKKTFTDGFISGLSIVFFAEIGDRTFILIMIYSIYNNFLKTFLISNCILLSWNLVSILIGLNMQYYINRALIEWFGIIFFSAFGFLMIYEGFHMKSKLLEEEFFEEEENLRKIAHLKYLSFSDDDSYDKNLLVKDDLLNNLNEKFLNKENEGNTGARKNNLFDSSWAFCFTLFWSEISDKSQIATIIIGATLDLLGVILGTSLAHMICSIIAISFGRIFSQYITIKQITIIGGIIFLLFSLLFLIDKI